MDKAWELGNGTGKLELWIYYVIVTEHNEGNYRDMRYTWMSQALKGTPGRYDGPMVYGTYDIGLHFPFLFEEKKLGLTNRNDKHMN